MQDAESFMLQLLQCAGIAGVLPAALTLFEFSTKRRPPELFAIVFVCCI